MPSPLTKPPRREFQTFWDFPLATDLDQLEADVAILGLPYGAAYTIDEVSNDQTNAPTAIRRHCERALRGLDRWDFDIGGTLLDGRDIRVVDCGDVIGDQGDLPGHIRRGEQAVRKILAAGALPIVLGGDHGIPIPVLRAYENHGPDHARAGRRAYGLARSYQRRDRGAVEPDPPRLRVGPCRGDLPDRIARGR